LKEVQPLYEIPLWFPHEIDLHSEGEHVVPKEQHTHHDCRRRSEELDFFSDRRIDHQKSASSDQIVEMQNWKPLEIRKRTITSLSTDNSEVKEAN